MIKLTALSKDYFKIGWNNFDLFIVILSLPDLAIYFGKIGDVPGVSQLAGIVKIFRLVRLPRHSVSVPSSMVYEAITPNRDHKFYTSKKSGIQ